MLFAIITIFFYFIWHHQIYLPDVILTKQLHRSFLKKDLQEGESFFFATSSRCIIGDALVRGIVTVYVWTCKIFETVFKSFIIFIYNVLCKNYINNLQEGKYLKAFGYTFKKYEKNKLNCKFGVTIIINNFTVSILRRKQNMKYHKYFYLLHKSNRSQQNPINEFISMNIGLQLCQQLNIHEVSWVQVKKKTCLPGKTAMVTKKYFMHVFCLGHVK